jgi:hypothetical protein
MLARHRITLGVAALAPGRVAFAWALAPAGRRTRNPARISVTVRMKRAGTVHLTLRLNAAVMRTLGRARHGGLKVSGTAGFTPKSARTVKVRRSFRIGA